METPSFSHLHSSVSVWSEPLWDGNSIPLSYILRDSQFDPNHCGMETILSQRLISISFFMFDPNHCGMETIIMGGVNVDMTCLIRTIVGWKRSYNILSRPLRRLIRTIVGWKLGNGVFCFRMAFVWSEPLWDGNATVALYTGPPLHVWSEPLWDGNFESSHLLTSSIVWSEPLWDGNAFPRTYSIFSPRLIRTIVGWKLFDNLELFIDIDVWSEPLWDGNALLHPTSLPLLVWSEPLWDGNNWKRYLLTYSLLFDPNHCGMETCRKVNNKNVKSFDPNHCGMETHIHRSV